ncbi:sigma-70 family RNA polymerase sigma factor [Streptacidiphilus sp. PB12-B1b]|uniref:sigma-70 family RNA polymerase sigma factor n=1 Tax=Streptacidiphilus sp. PB12-B1b TaxID=2705012 RepID=UPI0015FC9E5F|nr:sigma-70 family RNA polymerase sigma factor [Streptacidiphilus sp. PB12-B1b]QMU79537.1 sigma-70 family RNA polymerase sigma factor [Streptacidiphilus sp. PB12-B1b]
MTTRTQARAVPRQRGLDEAWEHLTDALYTYCLSVLCDQAEAVAAVREVRRLAARHRRRLRRPALQRAWLYALARYCCLLRMENADPLPGGGRPQAPGLGRLAWPETAGSTPAQREALELTGRHGLGTGELAAVLGMRDEQAGALVARAVCEMERTAAALSVLDADGCPELRRLGGERGPVLGPALRGELVRHLDDCPTCRGTAERAAALGPWPGTLRAPGTPGLVAAPGELRQDAGAEGFVAQLGRRDDTAREPRFDRRGFPVHRAAPSQRAVLLRQRAVAGSVIAAVVAAPVVAFWSTHQRHPVQSAPVSSVSVATPEPEPAGPQSPGPWEPPEPGPTAYGPGGPGAGAAAPAGPPAAGPAPGGAGTAPGPAGASGASVASAQPAAQLEVTAAEVGGRTVVTLADSGSNPTAWQITGGAPWLRLSRGSGTLRPGERATVLVTVDPGLTPVDPWTARLTVQPSGAVVTLRGPGTGRRTLPPPSAPSSSPTAPGGPVAPTAPSGPTPAPSGSAGAPGTPTASPTAPPTGQPVSTPSAPASGTPAPVASATPPATDQPQGRHRRPG